MAISYGAYSDRDIKIGHSKSFQKFFLVSETYGQVYQIIYPLINSKHYVSTFARPINFKPDAVGT